MTAPEPGPIAAAVAALRDFAQQASGGEVTLGSKVAGGGNGLWLWPYEVRPQQQTTGGGPRHPYRLAVRCVLAPGTVPDSLPALDLVLAAAVRAGTPELITEPPDVTLWQALGQPPVPALVFQVPASITHALPPRPAVRGPLVLKQLDLRPLAGILLGPGDQPVSAARVEVAGAQLSSYTDGHGRFTFPAIPVADRVALRVVGRGRTFAVTVPLATGTDAHAEPVIVRCDFLSPPGTGESAGTADSPGTTDSPGTADSEVPH